MIIDGLPTLSTPVGTDEMPIERGQTTYKATLDSIQWASDAILAAASAFAIPASGSSVSYNMTGLTSDHRLVLWNFSASAENSPPADLKWDTYSGYFTITNNGGTTAETITPVFVNPKAVALSSH